MLNADAETRRSRRKNSLKQMKTYRREEARGKEKNFREEGEGCGEELRDGDDTRRRRWRRQLMKEARRNN